MIRTVVFPSRREVLQTTTPFLGGTFPECFLLPGTHIGEGRESGRAGLSRPAVRNLFSIRRARRSHVSGPFLAFFFFFFFLWWILLQDPPAGAGGEAYYIPGIF